MNQKTVILGLPLKWSTQTRTTTNRSTYFRTRQIQLHLQLDALRTYGCQEVVKEKASALKERPALRELLAQVQPGDTVVVWKLDRLGRSLKHLVELVLGFQERQI